MYYFTTKYKLVITFQLQLVTYKMVSWSGQTKDYKIGICYFSAKHSALRRKNKDWLARNQNNVSEWSDMSTPQTVVSVS
jgi:hypothetical protein